MKPYNFDDDVFSRAAIDKFMSCDRQVIEKAKRLKESGASEKEAEECAAIAVYSSIREGYGS